MKSKFYPRRTFIADQIDNECPNKTSLYYQLAFQKVYIIWWIQGIVIISFLGLFGWLEYSKTSVGSFIWQSKNTLDFIIH